MATDEELDARHEAHEAVVRRACQIMGWEFVSKPTFGGVRTVAQGQAVAISVEKLDELLDAVESLRSETEAQSEHDVRRAETIDELECTLDDEEDAHRETLRLLEAARGEIDRLRAEAEATWMDVTANKVDRDLYDLALDKEIAAEQACCLIVAQHNEWTGGEKDLPMGEPWYEAGLQAARAVVGRRANGGRCPKCQALMRCPCVFQ